MADIDFARIIADAIRHHADHGTFPGSHALLGIPMPDLCPDCHGTGELGDIPELRIPSVSCDHPNAPTVGRLLRIGEAVWRADSDKLAVLMRVVD